MHRLPNTALLAVAAFSIAACGDTQQQILSPDAPAFTHSPAAACDAGIASEVENIAIPAAFSRSQQVSEAKRKFRAIKTACPGAQAVALSVAFIDWSLTYWPNGIVSSAGLTALWHALSAYVTPLDQLQFDPSALTYGGVDVCDDTGCTIIGVAKTGGIHIPAGALPDGPRVFGFWQTSCFESHLNAIPLCFDHRAWPALPPTGFAVAATIAVCPVEGTPFGLLQRALVGRKHNAEFKVTAAGSLNPFADIDCKTAKLTSAAADRDGPFAGNSLLAGLKSRLVGLLTPELAYATHPSMTGTTRLLSIWGATDPQVFLDTFTDSPLGPLANGTAAEVGVWEVQTESPGSVTVVSSLGNFPDPPAVQLNQQGGTPSGGLGLQLRGVLHNAPAAEGIYAVSWRSMIASPNVDSASVFIRDAANKALARIRYTRGASAQSGALAYMVGSTPNSLGSWTWNQNDLFELVVNLYEEEVSISVNGVPFGTFGFSDPAASNIHRITVEMTGKDIHTFGWDDISIARTPDPI